MRPIRWRFAVITAFTLWALYYSAPTAIYFSQPKEVQNDDEHFAKVIPAWLPANHVKLGLDLRGGVQLVLGVDTDNSIENRLGQIAVEVKRWSDDGSFGVDSAYVEKGVQQMTIILKPEVDVGDFNVNFKKEFNSLQKMGKSDSSLYYGFSSSEMGRIKKSALEQAERVVRNRVDQWGVSEPIIFRRADGSILVQLPGFKDPTKAKELLGKTAQLKFKIVDDDFEGFKDLLNVALPEGVKRTDNGGQEAFVSEDRAVLTEFLKDKIPTDRELLFSREQVGDGLQARYRWTSYVIHAVTMLTGSDVSDATLTQGSSLDRRPVVSIELTGPGGKRFSEATGENVNKRMAIVLDDVVEQAPTIQQKITGGRAQISLGRGRDVVEEGTQLALVLRSGAIPAAIDVLEQRQVGASLGPELANQGIKGILVGLLFVLLFMLMYYRRSGAIACVALTLNGFLMLAVMAAFGFTLTLPGIAAFILTLGMAVDANVLINERIRYELREGKNPRKSVQTAFDKVFWTIIDANVTTLIAAMVLLETSGSGPIRGFAVTLMIGLIVSLFTSLYCSHFLFDVVLEKISEKKIRGWLLGSSSVSLSKTPRINWNFLKAGWCSNYTGCDSRNSNHRNRFC